jgi:hypothetical protein
VGHKNIFKHKSDILKFEGLHPDLLPAFLKTGVCKIKHTYRMVFWKYFGEYYILMLLSSYLHIKAIITKIT